MIPRELVKKLKTIEIHTSRLANEQLAGSYHSVFKGRGMAFTEVREYQPGDDVRFIDWNVSARMNDTYVKVFTEEREMTVMLLVDLSASELFGSVARPKIETVAEIAALLAFSATRNDDRVGLVMFTDRIERYVPPKKGRAHVMRVVTEILNAKPKHRGTSVATALDLLGRVGKHGSVAFVISDFMASDFEKPLRLAAARHDVVPIQVVDPREEELPDVGLALVEDLETGEIVEIDTSSARVRAAYADTFSRKKTLREQTFRRLRVDHVTVRTDKPYVKPLVEFFRMRERRAAGYR